MYLLSADFAPAFLRNAKIAPPATKPPNKATITIGLINTSKHSFLEYECSCYPAKVLELPAKMRLHDDSTANLRPNHCPHLYFLSGFKAGDFLKRAPVNRELSTAAGFAQSQRQRFGGGSGLGVAERDRSETLGRIWSGLAPLTVLLVEKQLPRVVSLPLHPDAVLAGRNRHVTKSEIDVGLERRRGVRPQTPQAARL